MSPHHGIIGSSSRHHTALLRRLCGVTRILPLRGRSRYMSPHHVIIGSSPRHHTALTLVRGYQNFAPSGLLKVYVSSSRYHRLLLTAPQAPPHGTTLRSFVACTELPGFCPFGAARGNSPFSILHSQFSGPASFRTLRSCGVTSVKIFRCEKSRMAASTAPITSEMVQAAQMPVSPFSPALVNSTGTM